MEQLKLEIAAELGYANYNELDKGALPARVHGMIGGAVTKRLIEMGQMYLAGQDPSQSNLDYASYAQDAQQDLQNAVNPPASSAQPGLPGQGLH
jgi:hypothetical protein